MELNAPDRTLEPQEMSAIEAEEVAQYRSPSLLAFVGLFLGLASPLVFVGPLLYVLPVMAIVLGLLALQQISASEGSMTGRSAAIVGVTLATLCLFAAGSNAYMTKCLLRAQAQMLAEQWFDYLKAGSTREALRLTWAAPAVAPRDQEPEQGESKTVSSEESRRLEKFVEHPIVQNIVKLGSNADVRFVNEIGCTFVKAGTYRVEQLYAITSDVSEDSDRETQIHMTMERYAGQRGGEPYWLITGYAEEAAETL